MLVRFFGSSFFWVTNTEPKTDHFLARFLFVFCVARTKKIIICWVRFSPFVFWGGGENRTKKQLSFVCSFFLFVFLVTNTEQKSFNFCVILDNFWLCFFGLVFFCDGETFFCNHATSPQRPFPRRFFSGDLHGISLFSTNWRVSLAAPRFL